MAATKPRKRSNKPRRSMPWRRWLGWSALGLLGFVSVVVLIYGFWASSFDIKAVEEMPQRSTVYDLDGKIYSRLQGENRLVVKRTEVAQSFVDALLVREDARFHRHHGIDPIGIARAVVRNFTAKKTQQGASTLTQQLARNSYRLGGKNIHRKILEAFVAARIEQHYTKEEILAHYMNRIYFGAGVYGIETASLMYFGKSAKLLTLGESAMLAGIIRAPTYYSPRTNFKGALAQRDQVLARMVKLEKITPVQAAAEKQTPITLSKRGRLMLQDNYAMETVREDLEALLTDEQQAAGGLKIYTTIDPALQKAAQAAVDTNLRKVEQRSGYAHPKRASFSGLPEEERSRTPYLQGAVLVIDNKTGAMRAIVGGRDYAESPFNRARQSKRQIGSTFKPFVYAAAWQRGMLPGAAISDGPIQRGEIPGAPSWTPQNSDGAFKGTLPAEEGLIQSRNTMSVRIGERAGLPQIVRLAKAAGFDQVPQEPRIYLGAFETTLTELTSAYTIFPNNGIRRQPYIIERIDDAEGETIYRTPRLAPQAVDPGACWLTTVALAKAMQKGTGASAKSMGFGKPSAGKTGTTNDYFDAWFIGYTSSLSCGVWVGLDQPKTIISKGYGATLALPIWADVMASASGKQYPAGNFTPPEQLQRCLLCAHSNEFATELCERVGTAYAYDLPASYVPRQTCRIHRGRLLTDRSQRVERAERVDRRRSNPAQGLLRSFRKFFGGN